MYYAAPMSTLTPDQAILILNASALPSLIADHPVTQRVITSIPPEKAHYRPDSIMRSAIDLAWHVVASEMRFLEAAASGGFDFTGGARPETIRTPNEVVDWYSERFAKNVDRLRGTSGDQLVKVIDFRGTLKFPAVIYLQIGLSHSIHHRGQLSMYLRPLGAKVPSMYGESFDAREAREKAHAASGSRLKSS